jgi:hypothetical protein
VCGKMGICASRLGTVLRPVKRWYQRPICLQRNGRIELQNVKIPSQIFDNVRVSAEVTRTPESVEASIALYQEPAEDIRLLGLMAQDVKLMESMLGSLHLRNEADYRSNLIVCRGAAERLKQRCTRLLGDGDVENTAQKGRSTGEHSRVHPTPPGTSNGSPKSRKRFTGGKK